MSVKAAVYSQPAGAVVRKWEVNKLGAVYNASDTLWKP